MKIRSKCNLGREVSLSFHRDGNNGCERCEAHLIRVLSCVASILHVNFLCSSCRQARREAVQLSPEDPIILLLVTRHVGTLGKKPCLFFFFVLLLIFVFFPSNYSKINSEGSDGHICPERHQSWSQARAAQQTYLTGCQTALLSGKVVSTSSLGQERKKLTAAL